MDELNQTYHCPLRLQDKPISVLVIGCGGTGGEILDRLVRLHFGLLGTGHPAGLRVTAVDGDAFSEANIGRQRMTPNDVGQNKARLIIQRLNMAYNLEWQAVPHYLRLDEDEILDFDLIITCVDSGQFRYELGTLAAEGDLDTLWLDIGNGQHDGQIVLGHLCRDARDDERLPNIFDLQSDTLLAGDNDDTPSCSVAEALQSQDLMINALMADHAMNLLWRLLHEGQLHHHGLRLDIQSHQITPIAINERVWQFMGYDQPLRRPDEDTTEQSELDDEVIP